MNTTQKTIIGVALLALLSFACIQTLNQEIPLIKNCDSGLNQCFGECRQLEECSKLQDAHDLKMQLSGKLSPPCTPPRQCGPCPPSRHDCGNGFCAIAWCP